jgi:hypothetical protein
MCFKLKTRTINPDKLCRGMDVEREQFTRFPLLRFRSALYCGYSGITDIEDGLFFVLTRARTFKKS